MRSSPPASASPPARAAWGHCSRPPSPSCRRPTDPAYQCPLYGCPQPLCDCSGLTETACINEEKTLNCQPDYCPDCNGGQYFTGCSNRGSGSGVCPALCAQMTCHSNADC